MKIAIINTTRQKYGGNIYENMIAEVLSENFNIKFISVGVKSKGIIKYLEAPLVLWRLYKTSQRKDFDIVIRNFEASLFFNKKPTKNVALIHHIDSSQRSLIIRFFYYFLEKVIFHNLKKFDKVVTVASFWKEFLKQKDIKNISKIYNCFNVDEFQFSKEEIEQFKKKYKLIDKPIVYIGNCRKDKGVIESYNALKNLNVYLVTSGKSKVKLPAINLEVSYRDYIRLLRASSVVVLMSKFKEGWNRTAHEAMLCKTPVVGSGEGGMEELLEGGGQIVCKDLSQLKEKVDYCLKHPEIGERGYRFAKNFTREKFKKDWENLILSLCDNQTS